jgi:transcriptional regulator with XRE-family HTH domain
MSLYKMPHCPLKRLPSFDIGLQFIRERSRLGLTQQGLAKRADVGPLDVAMWETGPHAMKSLQGLLGALGCKLVITADEVSLTNERTRE